MNRKTAVKTGVRCTNRKLRTVTHRIVVDVVAVSPCTGIDIGCRKGEVVVVGTCPTSESLRHFRDEVADSASRHADLSGRGKRKRQ
jgi:hypothetical protein